MRGSALALLVAIGLLLAHVASAEQPRARSRPRPPTAWTQMSLPFSDVQDLAVDPQLDMLVYARRPNGIYVSWDLGEHYTRSLHARTGLLAIDPKRGAVWTGHDTWEYTQSSGLLWGPLKSTLRVGTTLAIAPGDEDVRWTTRPSWGVIFRSHDGGAGWVPTRSTPARCCTEIVAVSDKDVYAFSRFESFHRSFDGGDTWAYGTRTPGLLAPAMFAVDPNDPNILYAVSYARFDTGAGLSKSTDAGRTWFNPSERFQRLRANAVAVSPIDGRIYVVETRVEGPGFRVHVSEDDGKTFAIATSGLELSRISRIVPHPQLPCVAFAVTDRGIFRTVNAGGACTPEEAAQ